MPSWSSMCCGWFSSQVARRALCFEIRKEQSSPRHLLRCTIVLQHRQNWQRRNFPYLRIARKRLLRMRYSEASSEGVRRHHRGRRVCCTWIKHRAPGSNRLGCAQICGWQRQHCWRAYALAPFHLDVFPCSTRSAAAFLPGFQARRAVGFQLNEAV